MPQWGTSDEPAAGRSAADPPSGTLCFRFATRRWSRRSGPIPLPRDRLFRRSPATRSFLIECAVHPARGRKTALALWSITRLRRCHRGAAAGPHDASSHTFSAISRVRGQPSARAYDASIGDLSVAQQAADPVPDLRFTPATLEKMAYERPGGASEILIWGLTA